MLTIMHDLASDSLSEAALRPERAAALPPARAGRGTGRRFHVVMAGVFVVIAVAGFTPSYWARVATGTFEGAPLMHVHGLLLFAWTALYLAQTILVASGRALSHRAWGMAGIALFSTMICSTVALIIRATHVAESAGAGAVVLQISVASFATVALASGLFAGAIASIGRPETHKRLMLLMMVVLVQAAVARLIVLPLLPPGPPSLTTTLVTALVTDVLIVAAVVHDWRTRGRPHGAYIWGGLLIVLVQLVVVPLFARSAAAIPFTRAVQSLAG